MQLKLYSSFTMLSKLSVYGFITQWVLCSTIWAATGHAQKTKSVHNVSVALHVVNAPLERVFKSLEKKTNFYFSYNKEDLSSPQISYTFSKSSPWVVGDLLMKVSKQSKLSFRQVNKNIIVQKINEGQAESPIEVEITEAVTVTGKVTDENGEGLPGVSIKIKGTAKGVVTDIEGQYKLSVTPEDVLVFSFIGYEPQEIKVGNRTVISVTLKEVSTKLEEVVVTGFGDISKRLYTGVSQQLDIKEVQVQGVGDVSQMLQGRAAGVNVQSVSGTFGTGPKITIRGSSSIFGDGKPLWVIDGVVQEDLVDLSVNDLVSGNINTLIGSSVAGLNPNDIESFDILKDAAATALYGTRSLNGVIVITTKKGKKNTPLTASYSGEFTSRDIPNYSQADILDSKENLALLQEFVHKGLLDFTTIDQKRLSGVYGIMARRINTFDKNQGDFRLANNPESRAAFLQPYERANADWFKTLFKRSVTQNHTVSLSGGGEKNRFYASLGYYHDPGWTISDQVDRATLNLRNTFLIKKDIPLTFSLLGSYRKQRAPGSFDRQDDTVFGSVSRDFDINPYSYALNTSRTLRPRDENGNLEYYTYNYAPMNILHESAQNYTDLKVQDVKFQMDFEAPLWKDKLKYAFTGAIRYASSISEHKITEFSNVAQAYRAAANTIIQQSNPFLYQDVNDPNRLPTVALPEGGMYIRANHFLNNFYLRNTLTFSQTLGGKHDLDLFLGQEIRYLNRERTKFTGYGLIYSGGQTVYTDPNIFNKTIQQGNDYFNTNLTRERTVSFFSRITYGLNGKYFTSFTGNMNGSNRQGFKNGAVRWTPTYTISGKWNIKEEAFLANISAITSLNLRASYGLTANAGIASNTRPVLRSRITSARFRVSDRELGIVVEDLQNDDLTWEKQFETNIGLDLGLLKNRISLNLDVYRRSGFDLFDYVITSGIGGEKIKLINNADMVTEGIEVSLRTTNVKAGDFQWTSTLNGSIFRQAVTRLTNKSNVLDAVDNTGANFVDYPRNALFSIRFAGLDDKGFPTYNTPKEAEQAPGEINFQDQGLYLKTELEREKGVASYLKYEGPTDPNQSISLQNTFSYKNWSLGVFVTASGGNKIRLPAMYTGNFSDVDVYSKNMVNRWLVSGDETKTNVPVIPDKRLQQTTGYRKLTRIYNAYNYSTERVADGAFVRLRTINLTYRFPKKILDRFKLSRLALSGLVQNPWLIYADPKLNGVDPEFYNSGGVASPITRQYTLSINIGI